MIIFLRIFLFILILASIFRVLMGCYRSELEHINQKQTKYISYDSIQNISHIEMLNNSLDAKYEIFNLNQTPIILNKKNHSENQNMNIASDFIQNITCFINCTNYSEPFKSHFLVKQNLESNTQWDDKPLAEYLYYYSPLFLDLSNEEKFYEYNIRELKFIKQSFKEPYNQKLSAKSNFAALLDYYAQNLIFEDVEYKLNITTNRKKLNAMAVFITYINIVRNFFRYPYGLTDVDFIVFNIIIPFRNKVYCIIKDKVRHKYCSTCHNITNIYKCCSYEPYDLQTKMLGEQHLKNAAQALHLELGRYIRLKTKNPKSYDIDCFFDEFTVELCHKINYDISNQEPVM